MVSKEACEFDCKASRKRIALVVYFKEEEKRYMILGTLLPRLNKINANLPGPRYSDPEGRDPPKADKSPPRFGPDIGIFASLRHALLNTSMCQGNEKKGNGGQSYVLLKRPIYTP
jgi:hypothetical protein